MAASCALATVAAVSFARHHVRTLDEARFHAAVQGALRDLDHRIAAQAGALQGARGLFAASESVERDEWRVFCAEAFAGNAPAGITALAFVADVAPSRTESFVAAARTDGAPDFRIVPVPDGVSSAFVVGFAEPRQAAAGAIGADVARVSAVRETLERARDHGELCASGAADLSKAGWDARCIVLANPLYRHRAPLETGDERRAAGLGWVVAVVSPEALFADVGRCAGAGIAVEVFDGIEPTQDGILHDAEHLDGRDPAAADPYADATFREETRLPVGGRTWTVRMSTLPAFDAQSDRGSVWLTAVASLVASVLLVLLAGSLTSTRRRAARLAGQMSESLRVSEESHRRILETTLDAVVTVDREGRIRGWNAAAERTFGWTHDEVTGRTLSETIVPPELREAHERGFGSAMRCGTALGSRLLEATALTRDGRRVPVEIALNVARSQEAATVTAFIRDVTERRNAESQVRTHVAQLESAQERLRAQAVELSEARDQADSANRAKSDFLATMSHEIRTPMNGVLGMTSLLLDTRLDPEQKDCAESIRTSADALLTIINDILDFSKIEAGKMSLEPIPFDLRVAIEEVVEMLAPRAAERGLELVLRYAPGLPRRFVADAGRIRQVVLNLLSNAVKFSEKGHVLVDVDGTAGADGRTQLRVRVVDHGIGIPQDKLGLLFQRFTQADASTTRRFGGTGLGLAICRRIAELMGGTVGVESEPGRGSTFSFTLDLPEDASAGPESLVLADVSGVRCLIVDDVEVNRRIVRELTAAWGMRSDEAPDGPSALLRMRDAADSGDPYGMVLLDLNMPAMDGLEVARRVRDDPALRGALLMMLTSAQDREAVREYPRSGIAGLLLKPIRASDLHDAVAMIWAERAAGNGPRLVTRHTVVEARAAARSSRVVLPTDPPAGDAPPEDAGPRLDGSRRIRVLLAEDNTVNQKVAARILSKLGCQVDVAANGLEAVEMTSKFHFDVIFMDCQMPEMDGYEATQRIRELAGAGRHVPIVAMTANALQGDRERCLDAGMDDYVAKPIRQETVREALSRWAPAASPCSSHT